MGGVPLSVRFAVGKQAITEARYFWEPQENRSGDASIMFSRSILEFLICALFISLHGYPELDDEESPAFEPRFLAFEPGTA